MPGNVTSGEVPQGDIHPGDSFQEAYDLILSLRFEEARVIIDNQLNNKDNRACRYYLENLQEFLEVMITEEPERYEQYREHFHRRMDQLKDMNDRKSPYYLFFQAEMHMHSFIAGFKFLDSWKAAVHFLTAFRLINENISLFPDFTPNKKVRGIQNTVIGAVPDNYQWIIRIMGLDGNGVDGISQLNDYREFTKNSVFSELEVVILLTHVYIQNSPSDDAAWEFIRMYEPAPYENPLFRFTYILALNKAGRNYEVIRLVERNPQGSNEFPFYFLDLLYGEAKLNRLDNALSTHACHPTHGPVDYGQTSARLRSPLLQSPPGKPGLSHIVRLFPIQRCP